MLAIHHVFSVAASPARVYEALTKTEALAGWWTTVVEGGTDVGDVIDFTFGGDFDTKMRISALEPGSRVVWELAEGHPNWEGSTFEFSLARSDAGTTVRFWQNYGRKLSDDDFGVYNYNWAYYLESLRLLCETGKGKPFEPDEKLRATGS